MGKPRKKNKHRRGMVSAHKKAGYHATWAGTVNQDVEHLKKNRRRAYNREVLGREK